MVNTSKTAAGRSASNQFQSTRGSVERYKANQRVVDKASESTQPPPRNKAAQIRQVPVNLRATPVRQAPSRAPRNGSAPLRLSQCCGALKFRCEYLFQADGYDRSEYRPCFGNLHKEPGAEVNFLCKQCTLDGNKCTACVMADKAKQKESEPAPVIATNPLTVPEDIMEAMASRFAKEPDSDDDMTGVVPCKKFELPRPLGSAPYLSICLINSVLSDCVGQGSLSNCR